MNGVGDSPPTATVTGIGEGAGIAAARRRRGPMMKIKLIVSTAQIVYSLSGIIDVSWPPAVTTFFSEFFSFFSFDLAAVLDLPCLYQGLGFYEWFLFSMGLPLVMGLVFGFLGLGRSCFRMCGKCCKSCQSSRGDKVVPTSLSAAALQKKEAASGNGSLIMAKVPSAPSANFTVKLEETLR